jgi:hypothetical protein
MYYSQFKSIRPNFKYFLKIQYRNTDNEATGITVIRYQGKSGSTGTPVSVLPVLNVLYQASRYFYGLFRKIADSIYAHTVYFSGNFRFPLNRNFGRNFVSFWCARSFGTLIGSLRRLTMLCTETRR